MLHVPSSKKRSNRTSSVVSRSPRLVRRSVFPAVRLSQPLVVDATAETCRVCYGAKLVGGHAGGAVGIPPARRAPPQRRTPRQKGRRGGARRQRAVVLLRACVHLGRAPEAAWQLGKGTLTRPADLSPRFDTSARAAQEPTPNTCVTVCGTSGATVYYACTPISY